MTDGELHFSADSLLFDTVFTGISSPAAYLKVYNPHEQLLKILEIKLIKGEGSPFQMNCNGTPGNSITNIEIPPRDSLFIFLKANIPPSDDKLLPAEDKIRFSVKNRDWDIYIAAFGQNVHILNDSVIDSRSWTNKKSYLIYNRVVVKENEILSVEEGTHIYFHRGAEMVVKGSIKVNGSYDHPVVFEGDRLNSHQSIFTEDSSLSYKNVAGQWAGITLDKDSRGNMFKNTTIKNAQVGIFADSASSVFLYNVRISNHSFAGIYAEYAGITAGNCLVHHCNISGLRTNESHLCLYHCTFVGDQAEAVNLRGVSQEVKIHNSLITSADGTEAMKLSPENISAKISHSLITSDALSLPYFFECVNSAPLFVDIEKRNYNLQQNSPGKDIGSSQFIDSLSGELKFDLNNRERADGKPDAGVFEVVSE
ncbi:MAG: hypothetical protein CSB06_01655 [Bacteroidia bacterium]|nr:MAG: hypothetical protein CSB06_01655 [Bacteroidia bacterium]